MTIAAPPDAHAALAIEVCDAGRHVICEKPFALDAAEAAAMAAAANRAGVTHLVGHEFRWAPDRADGRARAIADGLIGDAAARDARAVRAARRRSRGPRSRMVVRRGPRAAAGWARRDPTSSTKLRGWFGELASVERDAADRCRPSRCRRFVRRARGVGVGRRDRDAANGGVVDAGGVGPHHGGRHRRHARSRRGRRVVLRPVGPATARACPTISRCHRRRTRATIRAIAIRTSSSARTRACARRCAPVSKATRRRRAFPYRRLPTGWRACACSTRSARRPRAGGARDGGHVTGRSIA